MSAIEDRPAACPARMVQHPDRAALQAEAHARPPMLIGPQHREIWHYVLFDSGPDEAWPDPVDPSAHHQRIALEDGLLRIERHTEFVTLTFRGEKAPGPGTCALIEACPGVQLAGLRIVQPATLDDETLAATFGGARLFGGRVNSGRAEVVTDFNVAATGMVTVLLGGAFEDDYSRGRIAKRLMDIETYRMGALLGLVSVRACQSELTTLETRASGLVEQIAQTQERQVDTVIDRLAGLLADVRRLRDATRFRLGASLAYQDIVRRRLAVLGEAPVGERQTVEGFVDHRMSPAINTVSAFERRLNQLDDTVSNALELARTCVERQVARHNQALLVSMEGRARQQVHLGQAVEGMSVAAITYYASGLVSTALKGLPDLALSDAAITAASVPAIALFAWYLVHRARRQVEDLIRSDSAG